MKIRRNLTGEIDHAVQKNQLNFGFLCGLADWNHIRNRPEVLEFSKALSKLDPRLLRRLLREAGDQMESIGRDLACKEVLSDAFDLEASSEQSASLRRWAPFPEERALNRIAAQMAVFWALVWAIKPPTPEEVKEEDRSICY